MTRTHLHEYALESDLNFGPDSAKWSNAPKKFFGHCQKMVLLCLTILWEQIY